jgi:hypothetical protein
MASASSVSASTAWDRSSPKRSLNAAEIDDLERQLEEQVDHALQVMAPYLDSVENTRLG